MNLNNKCAFPYAAKKCKLVNLLAALGVVMCSMSAQGQVESYRIVSTNPNSIAANASFSITIRYTPASPPGLVFCENVFQTLRRKSVVSSGNSVVLELSQSNMVAAFPGNDTFCEDTFTVPGLQSNTYAISLRQTLYDFPNFPARIAPLGSICVGSCPVQAVPLNFSAGTLPWWFAIASLFGVGGYAVRRRGLNRGAQ